MRSWSRKMLNEYSRSRANHSWRMHQIHGSGGLQLGRQSFVRALVFHLWQTGEVSWSGQQMRRSHCLRRTLMLSGAEIYFGIRILVTLLPCCVMLSSDFALFEDCCWIWILMVEIIQMKCFHCLQAGGSGAGTKLAIILGTLLGGLIFWHVRHSRC